MKSGDEQSAFLVPPAASQEEEFLYNLGRGSSLLERGNLGEARWHLEKAAQLRPGNPQCQNLLGLVAFRQGRLGEAREIYEKLIVQYPDQHSLMLNLALVLVKQQQYPEAKSLLEKILARDPGNHKARELIEAMQRKVGSAETGQERAETASELADRMGLDQVSDQAAGRLESPARRQGPGDRQLGQRTEAGPFRCTGSVVWISGGRPVHCRLGGLALVRGEVAATPVQKVFRGSDTGIPFGVGRDAMHRVEDFSGLCLIAPSGQTLMAVDVAAGKGYFREGLVLCFLAEGWENLRLVTETQDFRVPLLCVDSPAQLVVGIEGTAVWMKVDREQPLVVQDAYLCGWRGDLAVKIAGREAQGAWLEFSGAGDVLLDLPEKALERPPWD